MGYLAGATLTNSCRWLRIEVAHDGDHPRLMAVTCLLTVGLVRPSSVAISVRVMPGEVRKRRYIFSRVSRPIFDCTAPTSKVCDMIFPALKLNILAVLWQNV